jgi:hypothetical protein
LLLYFPLSLSLLIVMDSSLFISAVDVKPGKPG